MITRDELIEAMARAVRDFSPPWFPRKQKWHELDDRAKEHWRETGRAALTAIESAGLAIVPKEATAEMLAAALPIASRDHSEADKKLGAAACLLLSGGKDIPGEGEIVPLAAGLAEDYRAMVDRGRVK